MMGYVLQVGEKPFNEEVWNTTEEKFLEQEIMVDKVKSFQGFSFNIRMVHAYS